MLNNLRRSFGTATHLKEKMADIIARRQKQVSEFKKQHSETVIGDVTIGAVMGGMRGLPGDFETQTGQR